MNIQSTQSLRRSCGNTSVKRSCGNEAPAAAPSNSGMDREDLVEFGKSAVKGAIPGYGAWANFWSSFGAAKAGDETAGNIAFAGSIANLAGTVTLGVGLIGGNNVASAVGGALLVSSGLTNGYARVF